MDAKIEEIKIKILNHIDRKLDKTVNVKDLSVMVSILTSMSNDMNSMFNKLTNLFPETPKPKKGGK